MRLIQIQDGISINIDKIDGIEQVDDTSCKVYVGAQTYLATFPYDTLLQMVKNIDLVDKGISKDEQIAKTMKKLDGVLNTTQFFAG